MEAELRETVTYLEMTGPEELNPAPPVPAVTLERLPLASPLIRRLTVRIGQPYQWQGAARSDQEWAEYLARPDVESWLIGHDADHAGLAEFEPRPDNEIEITTFGLVPEFVGKGIGGHALTLTIRKAWELAPDVRRVSLHTSTRDHPRALPNYRKRGLRPFRTEVRG